MCRTERISVRCLPCNVSDLQVIPRACAWAWAAESRGCFHDTQIYTWVRLARWSGNPLRYPPCPYMQHAKQEVYDCCPCVVSHQLPAVNNVIMLAGAWLLATHQTQSEILGTTEDVHHPCNGGYITLLDGMVCSQLLGRVVESAAIGITRCESKAGLVRSSSPYRNPTGDADSVVNQRSTLCGVRCCGDTDLGFGGLGCVRRTRHTRSPAKAERDQS